MVARSGGRIAPAACLYLCSVAFAQQCRDHAICPGIMKRAETLGRSCTTRARDMGISRHIAKPDDELRDVCCKTCQSKTQSSGTGKKDSGKCKDKIGYCSSLKGKACNYDAKGLGFAAGTQLGHVCPSLCPSFCGGNKKDDTKKKASKLIPGGNPACWGPKHTFKKCCDQTKSSTGNPECFSAKKGSEDSKFSFEVCCPAEGKAITCVDDPMFGNSFGDCSAYGPKMGRDGACVRDSDSDDNNTPLKRCPVSCDICRTQSKGGLQCWGGEYTFRRCCGGRNGDESCFKGSTTYTYKKCCNLPQVPKDEGLCKDIDMSPSCTTLARSYKCDKDFSSVIKGVAKGTTLGDLCKVSCKVCVPPKCKDVKLLHGSTRGDERTPGSILSFTCDTDYELKGSKTATCNDYGKWSYSSRDRPTCKKVIKACTRFGVTHGSVSYKLERAGRAYQVAIKCDTGYNLVGSNTRTCTDKPKWEGRPPTCEPVDCGRPQIANGRASGSTKFGGSGLRLICDGGYSKPRGKKPQCGADKKWRGLDVSKGGGCSPRDCKQYKIPHGRLDGKTTYDDDRVVRVVCDSGYKPSGKSSLSCTEDGQWDGKPASCKQDTSALPPPPSPPSPPSPPPPSSKCNSKPCKNSGKCEDDKGNPGAYKCQCSQGWEGANCEQDVNECLSKPCKNYGSCSQSTDSPNSYRCDCPRNWAGDNCETSKQAPPPSPPPLSSGYVCKCKHGTPKSGAGCTQQGRATCEKCNDGYVLARHDTQCKKANTCKCPHGKAKSGADCTQQGRAMCAKCDDGYRLAKHDTKCEPKPKPPPSPPPGRCYEDSTCPDKINKKGVKCDMSIGNSKTIANMCPCSCNDDCASRPCQHNGHCHDKPGLHKGYTCKCASGYRGNRCEIKTECSNPKICNNGGVCIPGTLKSGQHRCKCKSGFEGEYCDSLNPCNPAKPPCQNGGTCYEIDRDRHKKLSERYNCNCKDGFAGKNCHVATNECHAEQGKPPPCINGGKCIDKHLDWECKCPSGYEGKRCQLLEDACVKPYNPCRNDGSCSHPDPKRLDQYKCTCKAGWDGYTCTKDFNECKSSPCKNGGKCQNGQNYYSCSDCRKGWTGDNCEADINECKSSPCKHGKCANGQTPNSYQCKCSHGWKGDNCAEVAPPEPEPEPEPAPACGEKPCGQHGDCVEDGGGHYHCQCLRGFMGAHCDVQTTTDACESSPCSRHGKCENAAATSGGGAAYVCKCDAGFGDDNCDRAVNPCESRPCKNRATCTASTADRSHRYTCKCKTGYTVESDCAKRISTIIQSPGDVSKDGVAPPPPTPPGGQDSGGGSTMIIVVAVVLGVLALAAKVVLGRRMKVGTKMGGSELDDGLAVERFKHLGSDASGEPAPLQPWEAPVVSTDNPISLSHQASASRFGSGSGGRFGSGSGGHLQSTGLRSSLVVPDDGFVTDDVDTAL